MKKCLAMMFLVIAAGAVVHAQTDPPALSSWIRNVGGVTGYNGLPANVQLVQYSAGSVYVSCSGIPDYSIGPWPGDPNVPANQNNVFSISRAPVVNPGTKTATSLGPIGVWVNGVSVFNARDAMSFNNLNVWHQNAVVVEAASFDACLGHPAPGGAYHHHQNPRCLYDADSTAHSPIVGYAFDGFPIYGPYGYAQTNGGGGITRLRSSYRIRAIAQRRTLPDGTVLSPAQYGPDVSGTYPLGYYVEDYEYAAGSGELDAYNGRIAVTPEYPNGIYMYVATINANGSSAYPYAVGPSYYGNLVSVNVSSHGHVTIGEPVTTYVPLPTPPDLISPDADTLIQSLAVQSSWHAVAGASSYHVQFGADSLFASPEIDDSSATDTAWVFSPQAQAGRYYWRVRGRQGEVTTPWSARRAFSYLRPGASRWRIVSLSHLVADPGADKVFPGALSEPFSYTAGAGYASGDSLAAGRGYWIKAPPGIRTDTSGGTIVSDSIAILAGWNLIGSVSAPIPAAAVASDPPGITTSQFFGYAGSYETADTIVPGSGYWVASSEPGVLILSSAAGAGASSAAAIRIRPTSDHPPHPPAGDRSAGDVPRSTLLEQNYPNPFNPQTTIQFHIVRGGWAQIRVYDVLGKEVATLFDGVREAGTFTVRWDGANDGGAPVNSGVYFYRLRSGDRSEMRKMLLMR